MTDVYDDPGDMKTRFCDEELERIRDLTCDMTPGVWFVPIKQGDAPHNVEIDTGVRIDWDIHDETPMPGEEGWGWVSHALVMHWGPDVLQEKMAALDATTRTRMKHRLANANVTAWVGNNLALLLGEVLSMRQKLQALDLLVTEYVACPQCMGSGLNPDAPPTEERICPGCAGREEMPGEEARDLALCLVKERWEDQDGEYHQEKKERTKEYNRKIAASDKARKSKKAPAKAKGGR